MTTITFTDSDADFTSTTITKAIGAYTVSFSGGYGNDNQGLGIDTYDNNRGVYAYEGPEDQVKLIVTVTSGYTFDINSFGVGVDSGQLAVSFVYGNGSTGNFTQNLTAGAWQTLSSFSTPLDDVKQVVLSSDKFGIFQSFSISDIKAIVATPTVTDGNISIVSTGTGTSGTYKIGDTVTARWDDTATGDNNAGVTGATMDFSQFGGGSGVTATSDGAGHWTASYTIASGSIDATGRNVSVSATNTGGTTTTADSTNLSVDNVAPTTTVGAVSLSNDTGISGTDFITNSAAQTVAATLSAGLASGDVLYASTDGGFTWTDVTASVSGTTVSWNTTLANGDHSLELKVVDLAGNEGAVVTQAYTLDTTAPAASSIPSMSAGTDTGSSNGDAITANTTPVLTGTAEANSSITLYDTDGTTVLGTGTANGAGHWSIASSTLAQGNHSLTVRVTDAAGNVSYTSGALAATIDTVAPAGITLSTTTAASSASMHGAAIANLSASDSTAVTYALTAGDGANDVDNGRFAIVGNTLKVGASDLPAGTYHIYLAAVDAAGNVSTAAETFTVNSVPSVTSIVRAGGASNGVPAGATAVAYTVTFSENVTGVDASDFTLDTTGSAGGTIASVVAAGSANVYTVTVNALSGDGTLSLSLNPSGTGIQSSAGVDVGAGYTSLNYYTLDHTAPAQPVFAGLTSATDSGLANNDGITKFTAPTITGTAEANTSITLYDSDGTTQLGTTTANGSGQWTLSPSLIEGAHILTVKATDAAGNVSIVSSPLGVTIDTQAPTGVALSTGIASVAAATHGASVATLSAAEGPNVTYSLVAGGGGISADNGKFLIVGDTLKVGSTSLAAGTYHINVQALDAAGNASTFADTFTVAEAPGVTSIVRAGGVSADVATSAASAHYTVTFSDNVSGVDAGDFTLATTGTAVGHVASVTPAGSANVYTVTVDGLSGDGLLQLDLNSSGTGIQSGSGIAIDGGYTAGATYTLDHTAPSVTLGMIAGDNVVNTAEAKALITVSGTSLGAEDGQVVTVAIDTADGATVLKQAHATVTNGAWSLRLPAGYATQLPDGTYRVTADVSDKAGNAATQSSHTLVIDTTADTSPSATLSVNDTADGVVNAVEAKTVSFTVAGLDTDAKAVATFTDGTNTAMANVAADGTATVDLTGFTGTVTSSLAITDVHQNVAAAIGNSVTLDTNPPAAPTIVSFADNTGSTADTLTSDTTPTLTIIAEAGAQVAVLRGGTVVGSATETATAGTYTFTSAALADNSYSFTAVATDTAGNPSPASTAQAITIDATAPGAPAAPVLVQDTGSSSSDHVTSNPSITYVTPAAGDTLLYSLDGTAYSASKPSFTADGSFTVSTKEQDSAGNLSAASSLSFTLDTVAPALALTGVSGQANHETGHVLSGTIDAADAGAVITIRDGSTVLGTTTADSSGAFSFGFADLKDGPSHSNSFTATAIDAAGNTGTSDTFVLNFDYMPNQLLFGTVTHDASSHVGQVYALYEGLLGRDPDQSGAQGWVDALDHGASLQSVTQGFLGSAEGQAHVAPGTSNAAYVEQLYETVLHRQGEASGAQGWVDALNAGTSRADVANGFVFSQEHEIQLSGAYQAGVFLADPTDAAVARLYYGILDRAPDAGGLQTWEGAAHSGTSLTSIAQSFFNSAEYGLGHPTAQTDQQFVDSLYQNALGRPAEAGGEKAWLDFLQAGASRAQVAVGIAESAEAQQHLAGHIEQGWHLA